MKKILSILVLFSLFIACKNNGGEATPKKGTKELISLYQWKLDRFSKPTGQAITDSELNSSARFLYAMHFEFRANGEVRGIDKTGGSIIEKGTWKFLDNETSVNVELTSLNYDFKIVKIETGKMTLQAPTGNFLSGVGQEINLEFSSVTN
jgi:hypothetical protein